MAQIVDVTTWYTRSQSDNRYLFRPQPAQPPTGLAVTGTGPFVPSATSNVTDPAAYSYVTVTLTPPPNPYWAAPTGNYVTSFWFFCTETTLAGQSTSEILLPYNGTGPYLVQPLIEGAHYSITAKTIDYLGQVSASSVAVVTITNANSDVPTKPSITVAPDPLGCLITIAALDSDPDFDHYELYREEESSGYILVVSLTLLDVFTGTFIDQAIPATDLFTYKLRAVNTSGLFTDSDPAGPVSLVTTNHTGPLEPNLVGPPVATLTQTGNGALIFSFLADTSDTSPNLAYYRIYRRITGSSFWLLLDKIIASPAIPSSNTLVVYTDNRTTAGISFDYSASAVDIYSIESAYDTVHFVSAVALDTELPAPPGPTMTYTGVLGGLAVTWGPSTSTDVIGYGISWRYASVGVSELTDWSDEILVAGSNFTIQGLALPTTGVPPTKDDLANQFQARIRALDTSGQWSATYLSRTVTYPELSGYLPADNTIPPAPLTVAATINQDGTIGLQWPSPGASDIYGYIVERLENETQPWILQTIVHNNSSSGFLTYTATGLEPFKFNGKQYRFRVLTEDNSGNISSFNYALNPGFETGDLTNWTSSGGATVGTTQTHNFSGFSVHQSFNSRIFQVVPAIIPGEVYTYTAYVEQDNANIGALVSLHIDWLNSSSAVISTTDSTQVPTTSNYQRLSVSIVAPPNAAYAKIWLYGDPSNPTKSAYWDDIQFEQFAFATTYADGKTILLQAVDTVGPIDYGTFNLTSSGALGCISTRWVNPTSVTTGAYEYINCVFEVWRKVIVSSQINLPVSSVFAKIAEVPGNNDGAVNGYDDLDPAESNNITAQYEIRARDRFGNEGVYLGGAGFTQATSLTPNDLGIVSSAVAPAQVNMSLASATPQNDGSILLTWIGDTTAGIAGYNIYKKRATDVTFILSSSINQGTSAPSTTITFDDVALVLGTTYNYVITATNIVGQESTPDTAHAVSATSGDVRVPLAPTAITGLGGIGGVNITWTASATIGVSTYDISYSLDGGSTFSSLQRIAGTNFFITILSGLSSTFLIAHLQCRVYTVNRSQTGDSAAGIMSPLTTSGMTGYVPLSNLAPNPPTGLSVTSFINIQYINVIWTASTSPDVANYFIEYQNAVNIWVPIAIIPVDTATGDGITYQYTLTGLVPYQTYNLRIVAVNFAGLQATPALPTTSLSSITLTTLSPQAGETGGVLYNESNGTATAYIYWARANEASIDSYELYIAGGIEPPVVINCPRDFSYITVPGLKQSVTYQIEVRNTSANGSRSLWDADAEGGSAYFSMTSTNRPSPTSMGIVSISLNSFGVGGSFLGPYVILNIPTYTGAGNFFKYYIQRAANASPWMTIAVAPAIGGQTTFTDSAGLIPEAIYFYQVLTVDTSLTNSIASNTITVSIPSF